MWTETAGPIVLPTKWGNIRIYAFSDPETQLTHLAVVIGSNITEGVLVRIQSVCTFGHVFQTVDCDCGAQLLQSIEMMTERNGGVILYMAQEGRGVGLYKKLLAMKLSQDRGFDSAEAYEQLGFDVDGRDYVDALAMIRFLGLSDISLLTNSPARVKAITDGGIVVRSLVPITVPVTSHNRDEILTKIARFGHSLTVPDGEIE